METKFYVREQRGHRAGSVGYCIKEAGKETDTVAVVCGSGAEAKAKADMIVAALNTCASKVTA